MQVPGKQFAALQEVAALPTESMSHYRGNQMMSPDQTKDEATLAG
jgi:hypothetical protein